MEITSNRNSDTHVQLGTLLSAAEVCSDTGGASAEGNLGGTRSAPPSNTAPNNCNPSFFQPLRWGVDSLYLSYPGQLSESVDSQLRELKKLAQSRDDLAAKAQYKLGEHVFEVKDKSSGLFPFTLEDNAFQIRLSAYHAKKVPRAYVKLSSHYLSHKSPAEAEAQLCSLVYPLGEVSPPKVSRIDLFADFASSENMESWGRDAWVMKASSISQYAQDQAFTGWLVGAGSALLGRLYNKQIEIERSGKTYLEHLWRQAGWDGVYPVWRLEFEFKREVLDQLGLSSLPSETDKTRSRWPIHPLWAALSSIDWETHGGPLLREYSPNRAPSKEWVGRRALSAIASFGALVGAKDFDSAFDALLARSRCPVSRPESQFA